MKPIKLNIDKTIDCSLEDKKAFELIDKDKFRLGICCVITDGEKILLLKRKDSSTWQFVQGGIETSDNIVDTSLITLQKEMMEEVGLKPDQYEILAKLPEAITYTLPPKFLKTPRFEDKNYIGQAHIYYLVKWSGELNTLDFSDANEFSSAVWVPWRLDSITELLSNIKIDAYCKALIYFKEYLVSEGEMK